MFEIDVKNVTEEKDEKKGRRRRITAFVWCSDYPSNTYQQRSYWQRCFNKGSMRNMPILPGGKCNL